MKKFLAMLLALAMTMALAACGGDDGAQSASGDAFKLGGIGPLTGDNAIYGTAAMNGAQIAVDEINAKGGMQFTLEAQDDEGDGEKSINAYNKLLDNGMQVLVGTVTSGACIAVSAVANEDRLLMVTPSASSTDVLAGKDNVFQVCFTDPNQGVGAADYISANMAGGQGGRDLPQRRSLFPGHP